MSKNVLIFNPITGKFNISRNADVSVVYKERFIMTAASSAAETLTLATNTWSGTGVSTASGDTVTMPLQADFDANTCHILVNGVEQDKGVGLDVEFDSAGVLQFNNALDIGDIVTIERKY